MICGNCRYAKGYPNLREDEYLCKRNPPCVLGVDAKTGKALVLARWPIVRRDEEACGEFYARARE